MKYTVTLKIRYNNGKTAKCIFFNTANSHEKAIENILKIAKGTCPNFTLLWVKCEISKNQTKNFLEC